MWSFVTTPLCAACEKPGICASCGPLPSCALFAARYAEAHVKPVVSDFDTFTVGSRGRAHGLFDALALHASSLHPSLRGMRYSQLPADQVRGASRHPRQSAGPRGDAVLFRSRPTACRRSSSCGFCNGRKKSWGHWTTTPGLPGGWRRSFSPQCTRLSWACEVLKKENEKEDGEGEGSLAEGALSSCTFSELRMGSTQSCPSSASGIPPRALIDSKAHTADADADVELQVPAHC